MSIGSTSSTICDGHCMLAKLSGLPKLHLCASTTPEAQGPIFSSMSLLCKVYCSVYFVYALGDIRAFSMHFPASVEVTSKMLTMKDAFIVMQASKDHVCDNWDTSKRIVMQMHRSLSVVQVHVGWLEGGTAVFAFRGTASKQDGLQDVKIFSRNIDYLQELYPGVKAHLGTACYCCKSLLVCPCVSLSASVC